MLRVLFLVVAVAALEKVPNSGANALRALEHDLDRLGEEARHTPAKPATSLERRRHVLAECNAACEGYLETSNTNRGANDIMEGVMRACVGTCLYMSNQ